MFNKTDNKRNIGKIFAQYVQGHIISYTGNIYSQEEFYTSKLLPISNKFEKENLYTNYKYPSIPNSKQKYTFLVEMCENISHFLSPYIKDGYNVITENKVNSEFGNIIPDQLLIKKGSPSIIVDQKLNWHKNTKYNKRPNREVKAWLKRYFTVFNNSDLALSANLDPCEEIIIHAITIRSHTEPEFKTISYKGEKYGK